MKNLVMYFINDNNKLSISTYVDFTQTISIRNRDMDKKLNLVIYLGINETSKLFKRELSQSKLINSNDNKNLLLRVEEKESLRSGQEFDLKIIEQEKQNLEKIDSSKRDIEQN